MSLFKSTTTYTGNISITLLLAKSIAVVKACTCNSDLLEMEYFFAKLSYSSTVQWILAVVQRW